MSKNPIAWSPPIDRQRATSMYRFMQEQSCASYAALYDWSINDSPAFWESLAQFCEVDFTRAAETVLQQPGDMTTAKWFVGSELSFPAHLLRHSGGSAAIIYRGENGLRRQISFDELRTAVAETAAGLRHAGVVRGDRVAGFLPNCPEAVIAMLAASSIGAVWSSCSPDFGINGVVDRFGQIEPKILFCADGYFYNGKRFDSLGSVSGIVAAIPAIQQTVVVPFTGAEIETTVFPALPGRNLPLVTNRRYSNPCRSTIRSTSCIRRALPACRSALFTAPAGRCCST